MGNGMGRSHLGHRRAVHTPWAAIVVIVGLLVTVMALASLELRPQGGARIAVWVAVGLGAVSAMGGALALAWQRLRARRGLNPHLGSGRRALWPAILVLLALAFLTALLPIPYPSPWLSLVAPLLFLGGAAGLARRLLSGATPLAYHRALRAYREGDIPRARALVSQAAEERPDDAWQATYAVRHLEAILLRESGELTRARDVADRLVAHRPELYYGHAEQGLILLAAGEAGAARQAFERAVARAPHLAEGHYNLGMARSEAGDAAGAVEALERALRLGLPDDVTRLIARFQLYRAYERLGLSGEAAAEARWLRRQRGTLRRWREALGAELTIPQSRRQRDEEMMTAIEHALAGEIRNSRGE
jgi:tetratricopeptide (TPR) repeat protein